MKTNPLVNPFSHPVYVMAKPVGSACNLACEYCYYLEKKEYYPDTKRQFMSEETLEEFIKQYIQAQTTNEVMFTWHGGEATMRSVEFYRKAMELQRKHSCGKIIENCLQTNGTLLNDEWCRFLKENNWLVGVSIDGPQRFHDEYRRNHVGKPSFMNVMRGIRMLERHGIEWNVMAVVNDLNADHPIEFYRFFKNLGCKFIQFTPVVERIDGNDMLADVATSGSLAYFSVTPEQWGKFLIGVFDEWVKEDVGNIFVQIFDATLANWAGEQPGVCSLAAQCGHAAAMEWNGDVYSCDHFVFPAYKLGNIHSSHLIEMMSSERQQTFGAAKRDSLTAQCRACRWLFACHGECPRNRFAISKDGEPGHNYLCDGYRAFFEHVAPYMDFMKAQLDAGLPPANVNGRHF